MNKLILFIFLLISCSSNDNKKNIPINLLLCLLGFALSMPGENDISPDFRFTLGIEDMQFGIPLIPVLIGFLIFPYTTLSTKGYIPIRNIYQSATAGFDDKVVNRELYVPRRKLLIHHRS